MIGILSITALIAVVSLTILNTGIAFGYLVEYSPFTRELEEDLGTIEDLHEVFGRVIERHLSQCHLVVMRDRENTVITPLLRILESKNQPLMLLDPWKTYGENEGKTVEALKDFVIGDKRTGCRAVIIYLPEFPNSSSLSFLNKVRMFERPDIKVLAIGLPGGEEDFLLDHSFRNTIHAHYFAFVVNPTEINSSFTGNILNNSEDHKGLKVYLRCLFCDKGSSEAILVDSWYRQVGWIYNRNLFPDQFKNFYGHTLRMAVKSFFPFAEFVPDSEEPGTTVTLIDCLELRMLKEMARVVNLTFEARLSIDDEWGQPKGDIRGMWTGLVGEMMRENADFGTCLFPEAKRYAVIDFTRMYAPEPFLIATLKPQPLPQYLAIVKPFSTNTWISVAVTVIIAGLVFWILQKGWLETITLMVVLKKVSQAEGFSMISERIGITGTFFYTWGILFSQPFQHPTYFHGRLWVTCWVIFSLLILVTYKSALIASLSVPKLSDAVDTIHQLLQHKGWTWGMEPHYSVGWRWLTESNIPDNQMIAETLEVEDIAGQMRKVVEGRHAFFTWKNYAKSFVAAEYTDKTGYSPIHFSRQSYLETSGSYWGCRRGAPFLRTIVRIKQHLFEGNLLELWLNQIFRDVANNARKRKEGIIYRREDGKQVVLSLHHLQGAFYLLFIGQSLAVMTLVLEYIRS